MTSMNGPSARDSAGAKKDSGTGSDQPVAKAQFLTVAEVAALIGNDTIAVTGATQLENVNTGNSGVTAAANSAARMRGECTSHRSLRRSRL